MKKSLTLCASILLLSSSAMAMDLNYSVHAGAGHIFVSVGDASGSDTNLMAGTVAATTGHSRALVHGTKAFAIGADLKFRDMFKVGVTAFAPDDDLQYVRDGVANAGSLTSSTTSAANNAGAQTGTALVQSIVITGGSKNVTVTPSMMTALKLQYSLGTDDANLDIGLGIMRSSDTYKYDVQVADATPSISIAAADDGTTSGKTVDATAGTTLTNDETRTWYGIVGDVNGKVYGNFAAKASLGYYKTDFEKQTSSVSSDLIVKETDAHAILASIGIGFCAGGDDADA